jgi:hypothetical protein
MRVCNEIEGIAAPGAIDAGEENVAIKRRAEPFLLKDRRVDGVDAERIGGRARADARPASPPSAARRHPALHR